MIFPSKFSGYSRDGIRLYPSGGGGGGPTNTTVTQSNIPEYLRPQVEQVLGGATKELFQTKEIPGIDGAPSTFEIVGTKPFVPYSTNVQDYVAGFSPLQQQVQANAANLRVPDQFNLASEGAKLAGRGGLDSADQAYGYGDAGFRSGMQGQDIGIQGGDYYGGMGADYGSQGAQAGAAAAQLAQFNADNLTNNAYAYGDRGVQAGNRGEGIGALAIQDALFRADMANNLAQEYGSQGVRSGQIGQQFALNAANRYGSEGFGYGASAANLAPQAQMYGQDAADIGRMGLSAEALGQDITRQARSYADQQAAAGQDYARQMTSPSAVQQYMNPYQSAVTDIQVAAAQRQADIARTQRGSQAARAGAFGGARQAIENAEADRALATQQDNIRAVGQQAAYDKAIQAMQYGSNLGLQGLGGAQSGLGTALQGGQLGLSGIGQAMAGQQAGISGLNQAGNLYGLGMQGAGMGLQATQTGLQGTAQGMQGAQIGLSTADRAIAAGQLAQQGANTGLAGTAQSMQGAQIGLSAVDRANAAAQLALSGTDRQLAGTAQGMQGAQIGLQGVDRQLAGTAQGMQGAQVGLQGVSGAQAGYGLTNQAASNLANIGTQQLAGQTGILGLQNQIGGQQKAQEQQYIDQAISNYAQAQNAPMERLNQFNALLRGYALPGTTTTQYQAQPTALNQIAGAGTALMAGNALMKAKGGQIREPRRSGLHTLALRNVMRR